MILSVSPANSSWLSRICRNFPSDTRRFRYDYFFFCRCQVTTRTQRAGASSTTSVPRPDQRTGISSPKKWHCCRRVQCKLNANLNETSAPVGAWEVKLEILTDKLTNRQMDILVHREVSLPLILFSLYLLSIYYLLMCLHIFLLSIYLSIYLSSIFLSTYLLFFHFIFLSGRETQQHPSRNQGYRNTWLR